MFYLIVKDIMYFIIINRIGYSNIIVFRRNGNVVGKNKLISYNKFFE